MAITPAAAISAYQAMARIASPGADAATAVGGGTGIEGAGQSFGAALQDAVKNAVGTMRAGETAATQGAAGKGDIVQVVNAVNSAELTLETVVAIRDKVISAYQDIMKMPI
jgi:flagellar hook-basal body complex protein FliE